MNDTTLLLIIALITNIVSAIYIYHKAHKIGYQKGMQDTVDEKIGENLNNAMDRIAEEMERENARKESRLMLEAAKVKQEWVRLQLEEQKLKGLKGPDEPKGD